MSDEALDKAKLNWAKARQDWVKDRIAMSYALFSYEKAFGIARTSLICRKDTEEEDE